jgi:trk system potassium uptake protein TrkA
VSEVQLPEKVILAAIVRDREVFAPAGHDLYAEGDELIFVAPSEEEDNIKRCFVG